MSASPSVSKFDLPPRSTPHTPPAPEPAADTHHLTRTRSFLPSTSIYDIVAHLNDTGATGTLLIDFSQGAMNSIRFREERKVNFSDQKS